MNKSERDKYWAELIQTCRVWRTILKIADVP